MGRLVFFSRAGGGGGEGTDGVAQPVPSAWVSLLGSFRPWSHRERRDWAGVGALTPTLSSQAEGWLIFTQHLTDGKRILSVFSFLFGWESCF